MKLQDWQAKGLGIVRILFGAILAIDASMKWSPAFLGHFAEYLDNAAQSQPHYIQAWIGMWGDIVRLNPEAFGYFIAISETLVAFGLLLGLFSAIVDIFGAVLMFLIWSTAEGFGGPYKAGSTDIGTAVIYTIVFAVLFLTGAGSYIGIDGLLIRRSAKKHSVVLTHGD